MLKSVLFVTSPMLMTSLTTTGFLLCLAPAYLKLAVSWSPHHKMPFKDVGLHSMTVRNHAAGSDYMAARLVQVCKKF